MSVVAVREFGRDPVIKQEFIYRSDIYSATINRDVFIIIIGEHVTLVETQFLHG